MGQSPSMVKAAASCFSQAGPYRTPCTTFSLDLNFFFSFVFQGILENLPALYSLNVPRLNLLSSPEVRQPGKAPNYSVNWAKGFTAPEVVDAMKGKEQVSVFF